MPLAAIRDRRYSSIRLSGDPQVPKGMREGAVRFRGADPALPTLSVAQCTTANRPARDGSFPALASVALPQHKPERHREKRE